MERVCTDCQTDVRDHESWALIPYAPPGSGKCVNGARMYEEIPVAVRRLMNITAGREKRCNGVWRLAACKQSTAKLSRGRITATVLNNLECWKYPNAFQASMCSHVLPAHVDAIKSCKRLMTKEEATAACREQLMESALDSRH